MLGILHAHDDGNLAFLLGAIEIRRGYSDENIGAILGGNFRRLLGATWI
jgi:membrane dipeptidase